MPTWNQFNHIRSERIKHARVWMKSVKKTFSEFFVCVEQTLKLFIISYNSVTALNFCGIFITESGQRLGKWKILWSSISMFLQLYTGLKFICLALIGGNASANTNILLHNAFYYIDTSNSLNQLCTS